MSQYQLLDVVESAVKQNEENAELSRMSEADTREAAQRKLAIALLVLSLLVVLACAAVLAALYAPDHMPLAISKIVENLSQVAGLKEGLTAVASVVGALGLLGLAHTSQAIHTKKPLKDFSSYNFFSCGKGETKDNVSSVINNTETLVANESENVDTRQRSMSK